MSKEIWARIGIDEVQNSREPFDSFSLTPRLVGKEYIGLSCCILPLRDGTYSSIGREEHSTIDWSFYPTPTLILSDHGFSLQVGIYSCVLIPADHYLTH